MKKIFLALVLVLLLTSCGKAETTTTEDLSSIANLSYKKEDGAMTILGVTGNYKEDLVIPETINGLTVKKLAAECFRNTKIKTLDLPDTLDTIGSNAFYGCNELEKLIIKADFSLDEIFKDYKLEKLTEIEFKEGSDKIYNGYYENFMKQITKVTIPSTIKTFEEDCFKGFENVNHLIFPGHIQYAKNIDPQYLNPNVVEIKEGSEIIREFMFADSLVSEVIIPESVKIIYRYAFANTALLSKVTFVGDSNLNSIHQNAFSFSKLKELSLPNKVSHIGNQAFSYSKIKSINIPTALSIIEKELFISSDIEEIYIPNNIKEIKENALYDCKKLTTINLDSIVIMELSVLGNNTKLNSINCNFEQTDKLNQGFSDYLDIINFS